MSMSSEKKLKKELLESHNSLNNGGKYGKIEEFQNLSTKLISQRVVSDDHFATIRYVGALPNSSGTWLGVDWDDATRGRHDGTHQGVKYFVTHSPKSGSFVRPGKVSLGLTVEEAIELRYGCSSDPASNYVLEEFFLESSDSDDECGTSTNVGLRKTNGHQKVKVHISGPANGVFNVASCQLDRLKNAVLHSLPVFRSMKTEEGGGHLGEILPLLEDLDLAQTLISDWVEVAKICKQLLGSVRTLNISDNKLLPFYPPPEMDRDIRRDSRVAMYKESFINLQYLILVRLYKPWTEFLNLFDFTPKLEHICLAYNKLSCLQPTLHQNFTHLSYLDLACNEISNFEINILPFGNLAHLHTLLLNDNRIENISFPGTCTQDTDLFPKLRLLAISNNRISTWDSIHHVGRLISLIELIFMFNPILDSQKNQETARQDVIAKLPRVKTLNRNEIRYDERKGAEIDYMKRYGKKWLESQPGQGDSKETEEKKLLSLEEFKLEHPRFFGLAELYGAPEQSELKETSRKLKERLIEVTIEYGEGLSVVKKKIPNHMTVQHLRVLLRKLCKIPAKFEFGLCYVSGSRPLLEIPLEAETREIGFYNVQSGDRVIVRVNSG